MTLVRQVGRFALVGIGATLLHVIAGIALIATGITPLMANPLAFLIAFGFSFLGHWGYTFSDSRAPIALALRRFIAVAAFGFILNETILALLLQVTDASALALICSVLAAAAMTFLLGRIWAFRPSASGPLARAEDLP